MKYMNNVSAASTTDRFDFEFRGKRSTLVGFVLVTATEPALAYVGPGAGLTLIGALWGLILAVLFVLGGLLVMPVRALMRKYKASAKSADQDTAKPPGETTAAHQKPQTQATVSGRPDS